MPESLTRALDDHAIVVVTDAAGVISCVNGKSCQVSGYGREELVGQSHKILNSGHHSSAVFEDLWGAIGNGKPWHGAIKNRARDRMIGFAGKKGEGSNFAVRLPATGPAETKRGGAKAACLAPGI
jgi:hypothetical protein